MSANIKTKYKVAAIQAAPAFLDLQAGIDKTISLIKQAADEGASLIAFPEVWLPGYPWWIWLDSPAWGMQFVGRLGALSCAEHIQPLSKYAMFSQHEQIHVAA